MDAVFKVEQAGPLVGLQDMGRYGFMRFGVTESGPMDRLSFSLSHFAVGARSTNSAIEISLGGLTLKCVEGSVTAAIIGGSFQIVLDGKKLPPWSVFTIQAGSKLKILPGTWGSWCYLAFAGDIVSDKWLGSKSVHLNSGLCGKNLMQSDTIRVANPTTRPGVDREILDPELLRPKKTIRVVMGPQERFFDQQSLVDLCSSEFQLTSEYNRMGVRLHGPKLKINTALDMPSTPITRGSLQVPGHGDPICLLADHQTTGGYPKIATVISADLDELAQLRAGDALRFRQCEPMQAVEAAREREARYNDLLSAIKENELNFTQRLWRNNLISGVVGDDIF